MHIHIYNIFNIFKYIIYLIYIYYIMVRMHIVHVMRISLLTPPMIDGSEGIASSIFMLLSFLKKSWQRRLSCHAEAVAKAKTMEGAERHVWHSKLQGISSATWNITVTTPATLSANHPYKDIHDAKISKRCPEFAQSTWWFLRCYIIQCVHT